MPKLCVVIGRQRGRAITITRRKAAMVVASVALIAALSQRARAVQLSIGRPSAARFCLERIARARFQFAGSLRATGRQQREASAAASQRAAP